MLKHTAGNCSSTAGRARDFASGCVFSSRARFPSLASGFHLAILARAAIHAEDAYGGTVAAKRSRGLVQGTFFTHYAKRSKTCQCGNAEATWNGGLKDGKGDFKTGAGIGGQYSLGAD